MNGKSAGIFCAALLGGTSWAADPPITVQYRDKPPYSYTKDGKPSGFIIERTIAIFKLAKVDAVYEEIPVKRITRDIRANLTPICSPSWYKLPERELFARFSVPIHQDKPHIVLAGTHVLEKARAAKTLKELFAMPDLRVGKVSGVSYGVELDAMLNSAALAPMDSTVTPSGLVKMIALKRADYMLIDQEDLGWLRSDPEVANLPLVRIEFADMPRGELRYLACSQQVPVQTMDKINQAIRDLAATNTD